ncbi:MAG: carboxypeptidase regulatory-like domain-containing protein [Candidatus Poribacteria bacterium]|nr:carboxypeptidase regulatory-like domain-containing protein [Candidatus Poribacteria bacterium]
MNCAHFKHSILGPIRENSWLFTATVVIMLAASPQSTALVSSCSLSGRVLDLKGNPVPEFRLILTPVSPDSVESINDSWLQGIIALMGSRKSRTDDEGRFSISDIAPIKVRLDSVFKSRTDHESAAGHDILSMKVGSVTVYPHRPFAFDGIVFAIKPDTHIENVEIRVRSRQYIRGRIVFPDGTPLASANIQINASQRFTDGMGSGSSGTSGETDAEGYFVFQVDEAAYYTVTVVYRGFTATAEPFLLRKGENKEDLVFTLERRPTLADLAAGRVEAAAKSPTSSVPGDMGAWVVNPENGHAYKRIRCGSWDDANSQAAAEGAYLVSISDAVEQEWLVKIFKPERCWIGLTDHPNEGEWVWASGEPVTYTNWGPHEPKDSGWGDEDYVLMEYSGEWSDAGPESMEWGMMNTAIIEKDSFSEKPSGEE